MDFFDILYLVCGLVFFLYGMEIMSGSLEKMAGGPLEKMLRNATKKPIYSLLLGFAVTAVIQSSSATTVILVGLVNSGLMTFASTVPALLGANIGTTVTAWLLSLSSISGESAVMKMLKPENFSIVLAFIGAVMLLLSKDDRKKDIARIFIGFTLLMHGMEYMKNAVEPLAESPAFGDIVIAVSNPVLMMIIGIVFTAIIQSSSASIGVFQALIIGTAAATVQITMNMAIAFVLGASIGTCITGILSCIGTSREAKRVAVIQLVIKAVGGVAFLALYCIADALFHFPFGAAAATAFSVALFHTAYSIVNALVQFPFTNQLVKLAMKMIPEDPETVKRRGEMPFIDERLLRTPAIAIAECSNFSVKMCNIAKKTVLYSIFHLFRYSDKAAEAIRANEEIVDSYEDALGTYLVRVSTKELSDEQTGQASRILHTIGDFERISDHAVNLSKVSKEIYQKKISFSEQAQKELAVLESAVTEILWLTASAFENDDLERARLVEPLEQVIDGLIAKVKDNHIQRLQNGHCTIELGFVLSDILNNFQRISDHCSNIAVAVIESRANSFDTHRYLNSVKYEEVGAFRDNFTQYSEKYVLG